MKDVLEKILEEIKNKCEELSNKHWGDDERHLIGKGTQVMYIQTEKIIRSHMNEVENDERLIKKYVTNRKVVRDLYNKPLYIKECCPKCGCELKSCETDYCRACGQALIWENPEGGL